MNILELKKIRNFYNLKREELAEKLNISKETLNTWEYRDKKIPEDKTEYIKNVFHMYFNKQTKPNVEQKKENSFEEFSVDDKLNFLFKQNLEIIKINEDLKKDNQELKDMVDNFTLMMEISLAPMLRHFKLKADEFEDKKKGTKT